MIRQTFQSKEAGARYRETATASGCPENGAAERYARTCAAECRNAVLASGQPAAGSFRGRQQTRARARAQEGSSEPRPRACAGEDRKGAGTLCSRAEHNRSSGALQQTRTRAARCAQMAVGPDQRTGGRGVCKEERGKGPEQGCPENQTALPMERCSKSSAPARARAMWFQRRVRLRTKERVRSRPPRAPMEEIGSPGRSETEPWRPTTENPAAGAHREKGVQSCYSSG